MSFLMKWMYLSIGGCFDLMVAIWHWLVFWEEQRNYVQPEVSSRTAAIQRFVNSPLEVVPQCPGSPVTMWRWRRTSPEGCWGWLWALWRRGPHKFAAEKQKFCQQCPRTLTSNPKLSLVMRWSSLWPSMWSSSESSTSTASKVFVYSPLPHYFKIPVISCRY